MIAAPAKTQLGILAINAWTGAKNPNSIRMTAAPKVTVVEATLLNPTQATPSPYEHSPNPPTTEPTKLANPSPMKILPKPGYLYKSTPIIPPNAAWSDKHSIIAEIVYAIYIIMIGRIVVNSTEVQCKKAKSGTMNNCKFLKTEKSTIGYIPVIVSIIATIYPINVPRRKGKIFNIPFA